MSRLESLLQYDEGGGESLDSLQYDAGSSVAAEDEAGLEFDMWEGQFEFIGQQYPDNNNTIEVSLNKKAALTNGHHEQVEDLQLGSPLKNGKVAATPRHHTQAWCRHLNHHVQMLQQQMNVLADNQNHTDERYTRAKQENATLQARVHMLEEQLREVELRAEERLAEEERRHRELVARVDREKQLQVENCAIRLQTLELENSSLKDEATRCRTQADKLKSEKQKLEEHARENDCTISLLKEEILLLREQEHRYKENSNANQQLIEELSLEVERLRSEQNQALAELSIRSIGISETAHEELQAQFTSLRDENRRLQEAHDEMQAIMLTRSVEEGRSLLTGGAHNKGSLAAELEAMSQDELGDLAREELKVRTALKEQQEVNAQLRAYIDGILLNIVENYPQLLEVKAASA